MTPPPFKRTTINDITTNIVRILCLLTLFAFTAASCLLVEDVHQTLQNDIKLFLSTSSVKLSAMDNTQSPADQWVDLYGDALFSYALKFISQTDVAQNLVQETFLAALQNRAGFKGNSSEKTWLIGILKNKIKDHLRLKYREIPASQLVEENGHVEDFFDNADFGHLKKKPGNWEFEPSALLENKEFWGSYDDCLKKLPEKTAQAFNLREIDAMDSKEVCKVLGISSTNLWVLLHRARLQLRQCLEMNWFENDNK